MRQSFASDVNHCDYISDVNAEISSRSGIGHCRSTDFCRGMSLFKCNHTNALIWLLSRSYFQNCLILTMTKKDNK